MVGTVISRGYGTFGTVNLLPVRGYGSGTAPPPNPKALCVDAAEIVMPRAHGDAFTARLAGEAFVTRSVGHITCE